MIKIFCPCWGHFESYLEKGLKVSLDWPRNKMAIEYAGGLDWVIPRSFNEIMPMLLQTIHRCIVEKQGMIMALPDMIFSDGTIATMIEMGKDPGTCISFAHIRVTPSYLTVLKPNLKNSWDHRHENWIQSNRFLDPNNSWSSGIQWRSLDDETIAIQHRLPSVSYANFTWSDLCYFAKQDRFLTWDTYWPGAVLFEEGRLRYVGSSDAAFAVEITELETHGQPLTPLDPENPDKYHMTEVHNFVNRCFVYILRKEPSRTAPSHNQLSFPLRSAFQRMGY